MPGVQKPHCKPWFSLNAACIGCKVPSACATASMVRMSAPSACMATIEQLLIALPFMCTVHAPHCAVSQPTCVPVRRRFSRMNVTRSVRSSSSADTGFPLTFMDTLTVMLASSSATGGDADASQRNSTGQERMICAVDRLGNSRFDRMRLLIVEDDAPLASGLRRILEAEGHAVDVTSRGEQAVLAAAQERFDLVILDIGLPQMDGFEVLRRLRAGSPEKNGPMPVLVLTARDAVDDRVRGLDLGADDYMVKPFAMPELTARVRALLRRSQAHGGPRIMHGPLALDTVARRAFLKNEPLELAAREWAVLEVLLGKVEKIVSKESIIQAVAGWGDDLSPNAIEVYVSRLRSKLEPAGIKIRTVRGFGYMLEEYKADE